MARKLKLGISLQMPGPRRVGKTWLIEALAADLRKTGWQVVKIDVQGLTTPKQFAGELCTRVEEQLAAATRVKAHMMQRLNNLLGGSWGDKPLDALGTVNPIQFAETLMEALGEVAMDIVILVDEIAYFVLALAEKDVKEAHAFAYQLRALQQRHKNVRWLITGSIGLDVVARRYDLQGAFVDFETFELAPFDKDEARSYLRDPDVQARLDHAFQASDADLDAMFDDLGWLAPFYLKLVANEVRPSVACGREVSRATKADFDAAFESLLRPSRKGEFAVWREHVRKNFTAGDRAVALHLLGALSHHPAGEIEDTLIAGMAQADAGITRRQIRDVLDMLINAGLLLDSERRFRFRSGLVRRYWQMHEVE